MEEVLGNIPPWDTAVLPLDAKTPYLPFVASGVNLTEELPLFTALGRPLRNLRMGRPASIVPQPHAPAAAPVVCNSLTSASGDPLSNSNIGLSLAHSSSRPAGPTPTHTRSRLVWLLVGLRVLESVRHRHPATWHLKTVSQPPLASALLLHAPTRPRPSCRPATKRLTAQAHDAAESDTEFQTHQSVGIETFDSDPARRQGTFPDPAPARLRALGRIHPSRPYSAYRTTRPRPTENCTSAVCCSRLDPRPRAPGPPACYINGPVCLAGAPASSPPGRASFRRRGQQHPFLGLTKVKVK